MERIKRNERMAALAKLITATPNRIFTLSYFCEMFGTAKSTMSEDVELLRAVFEKFGLGKLETVTGAAGGVRYQCAMKWAQALTFVEGLCGELGSTSRMLPGGFLYLSDVLSDPVTVTNMGTIFAQAYMHTMPDFVLTMETKGIPVALITAQAMGVPLVIARRSGKVYEGPAVNINYVSGSAGRIETMSLSRRAVKEGSRALIVDDFLKGGGTAKGMVELMREFSVEVVGTAFVMATTLPAQKCIQNEKVLMVMEGEDEQSLKVRPADWLKEMAMEG